MARLMSDKGNVPFVFYQIMYEMEQMEWGNKKMR